MKIKDLEFNHIAFLAPMAGIADLAFRELCVQYGAAYTVSEMVSSKGLTMGDKKSAQLLTLGNDRPAGVQIFGDDPEIMAKAAVKCLDFKPDIIDINMGCPAPKIAMNGGGASLMKKPELAYEITKAVVQAVDIPVTVKIRKGWDDESVNAVQMAELAEKAGADAITVHGRTRQQYYKPPVDYDIIRAVRESVSVPVIANGDIDSAERAKEVMDITGCDLVMIGRATLGNPWIFSQINAYLENPNVKIHTPDLEERLGVMIEHIGKMVEYKGEHMAMLQARKLVVGYFKGMKGAAALRNEAGKIKTLDDLYELRQKALSLQ